MLCEICSHIDFDQAQLEDGFPHHASCSDLVKSAEEGCELCRKIWNERLIMPQEPQRRHEYYESNGPLVFLLGTVRNNANGKFMVVVRQQYVNIGRLPLRTIFRIYADSNSEAAKDKIISGRPMAQLFGSGASYSLARSWLKECSEQHLDSCPIYSESRLPTRVLDVGVSGKNIHIRFTGRQKGTWISLSHCWGTEKHFTLMSSTPLHEPLNIDVLPPTFRDAITVTRSLGYRFLWIDSLCILQDSHADWVTESSLMLEYYKYAILTIAVDTARGDHEGFLGKVRIKGEDSVRVPFWAGQKLKGDVYIQTCRDPVLNPTHLNTRAWTLQENLLSPRVLRFGDEQKYECQKHSYTDAIEGCLDRSVNKWTSLKSQLMSLQQGLIDPGQQWMEIVSEYSGRQITVEGDRLPAISGIAREIYFQTKMTYKAGLWEEDLGRGLLWNAYDRGEPSSSYIAPSWSWASIKLPIPSLDIYFPISDSAIEMIATPVACEVTPLNGDLYGQIQSGVLTINGPIIAASQFLRLHLVSCSQDDVPYPQNLEFCKIYDQVRTLLQKRNKWFICHFDIRYKLFRSKH